MHSFVFFNVELNMLWYESDSFCPSLKLII